MFTLGIELYETDNGTLVVSSEAVRSENLVELLNKAAIVSGNMFRKFAGVKGGARKSKAEIKVEPKKEVAQNPESGTINGRKFDYYIALKYQQPAWNHLWVGGNLEGGLIWGNGMFVGMDFGLGVSGSDGEIGVGVSLGNVYDFGNQWQLVYGGSVGFWICEINGTSYDILAPFVKLRWKFVELTYRGLLGWNIYHHKPSYDHQLMLGLYFATNKRER
jgi:hypothetical protein